MRDEFENLVSQEEINKELEEKSLSGAVTSAVGGVCILSFGIGYMIAWMLH